MSGQLNGPEPILCAHLLRSVWWCSREPGLVTRYVAGHLDHGQIPRPLSPWHIDHKADRLVLDRRSDDVVDRTLVLPSCGTASNATDIPS
jgi:hypothetical protein